jgi:hypothetical protein
VCKKVQQKKKKKKKKKDHCFSLNETGGQKFINEMRATRNVVVIELGPSLPAEGRN